MFKVGDRVIDGFGKEGTVLKIHQHSEVKWPIQVQFDNVQVGDYTLGGIFSADFKPSSNDIVLLLEDEPAPVLEGFAILPSPLIQADSFWLDRDFKKPIIAVENMFNDTTSDPVKKDSLVKFPQLYRQCIVDRISNITDVEVPKLWKIYMSEDLTLKEFHSEIAGFVSEVEKLNEELNRLDRDK